MKKKCEHCGKEIDRSATWDKRILCRECYDKEIDQFVKYSDFKLALVIGAYEFCMLFGITAKITEAILN